MQKSRFKKKGRLVVLDGLDGSGKATQTKLLASRLRKEGYPVEVADFPQYYGSFFGRMVGRYLTGEFGTVNQVSPYLASILYAADRWEAKEKIENWLVQGKVVVCNRYVSANQIHQAAKIRTNKERERFLEWLEEMEFKVFGVPKPDLIIYLDVPYQIGQRLVLKKGKRRYIKGAKRDIHEASKDHLYSAQQQIFSLLRRYNNWHLIKCVSGGKIFSRKEIAARIWQTVEQKILYLD